MRLQRFNTLIYDWRTKIKSTANLTIVQTVEFYICFKDIWKLSLHHGIMLAYRGAEALFY